MYDFKQLSAADFEDLTRDLLQQHWKLRLETFKTGRDSGIDLRYAALSGQSIIVQCKHFASSSVAQLIRHLAKQEYPKVVRMKPKRYVLVTSLPLNPSDKDKIRASLDPYIQTTHDIFGAGDLNNLLGKYTEIETQHFKLWMSSAAVLQRVLHNAARVQTEFDVNRVRRAIPLYVQTSNYNRALKILQETRFVIISGVPGIGKTTLADMLLFAHLESGYQPVIIKSDISEGKTLLNEEVPQIFYFDDFLGETFLGNRFEFLGKKEDSAIMNFMEIVSRSKASRLILTTREHVLRHAYQISEHFRRQRGGLVDHQCILELSDYSLLDRARILYNHIYFSDLPDPYKRELLKNGFYMEILKHRNFNPRLIEWLSRFANIRTIRSSSYQGEVNRVLENPEQLWRIAFEQQISDASRSLLLALYSLGGNAPRDRLGEAWKVLHHYRAKKYNWKTSPEDLRRSLQDLEGGFLRFERKNAAFVNPSVKDFLDATLACDTDNVDDLLSTSRSFEQIVNIWSLAQSEKGEQLRAFLRQSPKQLIEAVNQNLQNPHQEVVELSPGFSGIRSLDVRPEVRLRTMLSIAEGTMSTEALRTAAEYRHNLIEFWSNHRPDFRAGVEILRTLDSGTAWGRDLKALLYGDIKRGLLSELGETADSVDLAALLDYMSTKDRRWTEKDRKTIIKRFKDYLEDGFDTELADFDTIEELEDFSARVEEIADWCQVDVSPFLDDVANKISELESMENEEVREVREWNESEGSMPEHRQEAEVRRIFDGFPGRVG